MAKFPKPLTLPKNIYYTRIKRHQQVVHAVKLGIKFRLFVILFEMIGVFLINSSALFLDAISSLTDVVSSIFLIICIKLAQRPPDHDHPFGHGRYEPMGGLLLGILLIVLGGVMFFQQVLGSFYPEAHHHIHPLAWLFPAIAMIILEIAYRVLILIAKKAQSPALAADAYHYRIDSLTSLFATIALIVAAILPEWSLLIDHIGAIAIASFMIGLGLLAARENFHQLMDRVPESHFFELVKQAASKTAGVEGTEKIRIQRYGPDAHVDIDIEVKPSLTVDKAHKISQQVRLEIQRAWPAVRDVTVHIEPYYANDH
jgi:cation diffusion facilitator family transporter